MKTPEMMMRTMKMVAEERVLVVHADHREAAGELAIEKADIERTSLLLPCEGGFLRGSSPSSSIGEHPDQTTTLDGIRFC